jgi:hypothetical protein
MYKFIYIAVKYRKVMQLLKLKNLSYLLILCATIIVTASCGDKEEEPEDPSVCNTDNLTYDNWAQDFINGNCATSGCHDANANMNAVPYSMHTYETAKNAVDDGRIIGAINRDPGFNPMPKGEAMLSDCDISKMEAWISDGAPE